MLHHRSGARHVPFHRAGRACPRTAGRPVPVFSGVSDLSGPPFVGSAFRRRCARATLLPSLTTPAMPGLTIPQDLLTMAAQAGAIALVAALVPNRLLLVVVAIAAAAVGLAVGVPSDFTRTPGALMVGFSGVFAGLAIGGVVIALRLRHERGATARRQAARHAPPARSAGVRAMTAGVVAIVVLALGAAGWHYLGDGLPAGWRAAAETWVGRTETRAPAAKASAGANQPAGLPAGAKGAAPAEAKSRERPHAERPQGDLRHCLQQGASQDVLRCAEGR
jgi:hypothetical protein